MPGFGELMVVLVSIVGAVIALVGIGLWIRSRRQKAEAELGRLLGNESVALAAASAQSFGTESLGATQARGNGSLSLSPTRLIFVQWVPLRPLVIPREKITSIETTNGHLGKFRLGARLLKVHFTNESGAADSVAWDVRPVDPWLTALRG